MWSAACCDPGGEGWNGLVFVADPKPVAKIVPERQAELLAGFHQTTHAAAGQSAVAADRADAKLPGIVGNDHHIADQITMRMAPQMPASANGRIMSLSKISIPFSAK